jgi:hypothetical protein
MSVAAADRIKTAPPLRLRRAKPRSLAIFIDQQLGVRAELPPLRVRRKRSGASRSVELELT